MPLFCCAENGDMRMEYGYARVSSTEQNLDRQILALQKYVKRENIVWISSPERIWTGRATMR